MGNISGQVCYTGRASLQFSVVESDLDCAFQDIDHFVFVAMHVEPISALRIEYRLEEIVRAAGLMAQKLVSHAEEFQYLA
jgi:hypothetical protein